MAARGKRQEARGRGRGGFWHGCERREALDPKHASTMARIGCSTDMARPHSTLSYCVRLWSLLYCPMPMPCPADTHHWHALQKFGINHGDTATWQHGRFSAVLNQSEVQPSTAYLPSKLLAHHGRIQSGTIHRNELPEVY